MSQPMHAGHASDRGGNELRGTFFGSSTNMHSLWDTGLPRRRWESLGGLPQYEVFLLNRVFFEKIIFFSFVIYIIIINMLLIMC